MCQRKNTSKINYIHKLKFINDKLKMYCESILGKDIHIEFLTKGTGTPGKGMEMHPNFADFMFRLENNPETTEFMNNHEHMYDLIIMHTAPLSFMGIKDGSLFNIFKQLLTPNGIISILAFKYNSNKIDKYHKAVKTRHRSRTSVTLKM